MWTTVAFSENKTVDALSVIDGVKDETHKVIGDDLFVGKWNRLIGLYFADIAAQEAYLISPSLRRVSRVYAYPLHQYNSADMNFTRRFDNRIANPLPLDIGEALNAYIATSQFSATWATLLGVWLADAPVVPIAGEVHTVKFDSRETGAVDYLAHTWVNEEIDIVPDLPVGRYAVVGARCYANSAGLFRFVSREMANRPGGILCTDISFMDDEVFHGGRMGTWLEFDSVLPPSLDVLQNRDYPDTDVHGHIDLIRLR